MRRLFFRNFRFVYRFDRWIKRRLTPVGGLTAAGLFAGALFGIDTRQSLAFQLFALASALFVVAVGSTVLFRSRLSISRSLPRFATVDEPLSYRVSVRNDGPKLQSGLFLREMLRVQMPVFEEFLVRKEPGAGSRNWFDRYVGYPRWVWMLRQGIGAEVEEVPLPDLPAGDSVEVELSLLPLRRGFVRFDGTTIARPDPLGLVKALDDHAGPGTLLVLPRCHPMTPLDLPGASRERRGRAASDTVGGVDEFVSVREYRAGDPLRHIHWKSWARLGIPVVKEFHDESHARMAILLDTFVAPDQGERFEAAVSAAASLVRFGAPRNGIVDLMFYDRGEQTASTTAGGAAMEHMLTLLACVQESEGVRFDRLREMVVRRAGEFSACVCVFLAWDRPRRELVADLQRAGVVVEPLVIEAAVEVEAAARGGPGTGPAGVQRIGVETVAADLARVSRRAALAGRLAS